MRARTRFLRTTIRWVNGLFSLSYVAYLWQVDSLILPGVALMGVAFVA